MPNNINDKINILLHNNSVVFWILQSLGWLSISLISYFSLNLWYNQPEIGYLIHNLVQSILGIILSWPLRGIFRHVWNRSLSVRLIVIIFSVLFFSLLWSIARLVAFLALTEESNLWSDFGGWYYPSIFIFMCWTALYHGIKYYQLLQEEHRLRLELLAKQKNESLMRSQAETQAKEALLKMLRYQINPHFLFNAMNSVLALVSAKKNARAQEMILQLSDFLRYSLADDFNQQVPLEKEIEALGKYLSIEQARFGDRLKVQTVIDDSAKKCLIPSLLLQPLLENSIKYAVAPSEKGGTIVIHAKKERHTLVINVEDSGVGNSRKPQNSVNFKSDITDSPTGMGLGLKNVQTRLNTLYPVNHAISFAESELGGTKVTIKLPAEDSAEPKS